MSTSQHFIKEALDRTGDHALSYVHTGLKSLIADHLIKLVTDFPTLFADSGEFFYNDGTSVNLFRASGDLWLNSGAVGRELSIGLTIWLHQAYPFVSPLVFVSSSNSHHAQMVHDHPYVEHSSGATVTPYLKNWQYPSSNLTGLAHELIKIFSSRHPFSIRDNPRIIGNNKIRDDMIENLDVKLQQDQVNLRAEVEQLMNLQSELNDRAREMERGLDDLRLERKRLEDASKKKRREIGEMMNWVQVHDALFLDEVGEAFEPNDAKSKCLLENIAADRAIDDLLYVLGRALQSGDVNFETYIKQVRVLTREQFFHRTFVIKAQKK